MTSCKVINYVDIYNRIFTWIAFRRMIALGTRQKFSCQTNMGLFGDKKWGNTPIRLSPSLTSANYIYLAFIVKV